MNALIANRTASRQRGVTLVELMVALLLGMLLTAGMIQVFASNRVTYEFNQGLSRIQENARFALDHIAYTTRMAGYRGCLSDVAFFNNLDPPNDFRDNLENGLQGHNANGTGVDQTYTAGVNPGSWSPALPVELINQVIPGSDVLIVRSVAGVARPLVSPFSDSAQVFVAGPHDFAPGEILVATDCQKASIFQLTESTAAGVGFSLVHGNAGGFAPGNDGSDWGPDQEYGLGSEVARLQTFAFYVGQGASGQPTLFQLRLQPLTATSSGFPPNGEELVEGVDSMQIRYGVDTVNNDGAIDDWQTADFVADWTQVLSAEVTLLARGADEYGSDIDSATYNLGGVQFNPVDDRRLRQVFSTTIGVRNRLP